MAAIDVCFWDDDDDEGDDNEQGMDKWQELGSIKGGEILLFEHDDIVGGVSRT